MKLNKLFAGYIVLYGLWFAFFLLGNGFLTSNPRNNVHWGAIATSLVFLIASEICKSKMYVKKISKYSILSDTILDIAITITPAVIFTFFH